MSAFPFASRPVFLRNAPDLLRFFCRSATRVGKWRCRLLTGCFYLLTGILAGSLFAGEAPGKKVPAAAGKAPPASHGGVKVPAGFRVTLFADDQLAHDIFCMTIDARGRVVVSGRGYIRILEDRDGDGKADRSILFADGPKSGAQGLFCYGSDIFCLGDAGLLRYRDRNGDDRADGPPDVFLKIKTGGEHHAHALRKGPDGWWYLAAGNFAGVNSRYVTLPTSPVKKPEGGVLLRLKPDLSGGEIVAHGFRNTYDFAFNEQGDIFTYDSDGERAISLPWYRPTRVFHVLPAGHAGWVSRSWKRPRTDFDMPPVLADFGRGSPTGVACYRHRQFPEMYRNALFVCDWTFGRVMALPLKRFGSTWSSRPVTFMTGIGQFGFAPTDLAVGPDGSLFVSVGGRGTRGSIFRVQAVKQGGEKNAPPRRPAQIDADVWRCLTLPQPLSSWSRAVWMPLAKKAGAAPFRQAALAEELPVAVRLRAIEILTELFGGLTRGELGQLARSSTPEVRARAVWSHGRTHAGQPAADVLRPFLADSAPQVRRAALQALLGAGKKTPRQTLLPLLAERLRDRDRFVRLTAAHVVGTLSPKEQQRLKTEVATSGNRALLAFELGRLMNRHTVDLPAFSTALHVLERRGSSIAEQLDAVRLMQVALGDCGPEKSGSEKDGSEKKRPPVFDGYGSRLDLSRRERDLDPLRIRLARVYPSPHAAVDYELARVIAMLSPYNPALLQSVLDHIDEKSHPVRDIHYLIVAARIPVERNAKQREQIARAFVRLDEKIGRLHLRQDLHWNERMAEAYRRHTEIDPSLPGVAVRQRGFGRPGHVLFLIGLPDKEWQKAIDAFAKRIEAESDYEWTTDVVFLLGESQREAHRDLIRRQFSNYGLRDAILLVLAKKPAVADRKLFLRGLESAQLEVIAACVKALAGLPPTRDAREQLALFKSIRRLGRDDREIPLRDQLVKLLQRSTGQHFGYKFQAGRETTQSAVLQRWEEWLSKTYPEEARRLLAGGGEDLAAFRKLMKQVDWNSGDPARGEKLFRQRSCVQCHGGSRALGPDLAGVARRFSRDDFFTAVLQPSRDVSPRYQTTQIVTTGGKVYTGLVVYDSVDGVTLRTAQNQTVRIEAAEIELRRLSSTSLMPTGLLKGLQPRDLADLYAYLRRLAR